MSDTIKYVVQDSPGVFTVRPSGGFKPINSVGIVPIEIPVEDWGYITATEADHGGYIISVDETKKLEDLSKKEAEDKALSDYATLEKDIYDKMYEVFRTKSTDTANADHETWKLMAQNPSSYEGLGLKTSHQVDDSAGTELFSPGSALDTAEKITSYATRKIEQAEEYAVFRMQRKQQFIDSKA